MFYQKPKSVSMRLSFLFSLGILFVFGKTFGQSAETAPLPSRFDGLKADLIVQHFPSPVYASRDKDNKNYEYFWKHTTSVLSPKSDVEVVNCGAYIFYNDQWNERVTFGTKEFAKTFNCKNGRLKQGQPYTFPDNWRTDNRLQGGWAMWWVIGKNATGEMVYGVGKLLTVGEVLGESTTTATWKVEKDASSLNWTGHAEYGAYAPIGTLKPAAGELNISEGTLKTASLRIDMTSLTGDEANLVAHLRNADFFDVEQFPVADFELLSPLKVGGDGQTAKGKFSIHGLSVTQDFDVSVQEEAGKIIVSGQLTLDRTNFGIVRGSVKHSENVEKAHAIGDNFELDFRLVFGK